VTDAVIRLAAFLGARSRRPATLVVGLGGSVAVGKTTLAGSLGDELERGGISAAVVSTDGFLLPNAELALRGILMRKGFPESYDVAAVRAFLEDARAGRDPLAAPVYSHTSYDVLAGERRLLARPDVLVLEGVNALLAAPDLLDVGVYVEADEAVVERWFVERFLALCAAARDDPCSFYAGFASSSPDEIAATARRTWRAVNLVNLREHIAPSRRHAHAVVLKRADHSVASVQILGGA
jgi:type I pantothenate kinase